MVTYDDSKLINIYYVEKVGASVSWTIYHKIRPYKESLKTLNDFSTNCLDARRKWENQNLIIIFSRPVMRE